MIKTIPVNSGNLKVTVGLKDGTRYYGCDVPENPNAVDGWFTFWSENGTTLLAIPTNNIHFVSFSFDGK
jgi:hypothetical protein